MSSTQSARQPLSRAASARAFASSRLLEASLRRSASSSISSLVTSASRAEKSVMDSCGNGIAQPTSSGPPWPLFAPTTEAELTTTREGSVASSLPRPEAALLANLLRASMTSWPNPITRADTACAPGTAATMSPTAHTTTPTSPRLSTQASSTCATVQKAATEFSPASAVASATCCTSAERDPTHSAVARQNTRERLTSRATATATVV